jgi:GH15 family glucan-1,4-alpha-glucosidase
MLIYRTPLYTDLRLSFEFRDKSFDIIRLLLKKIELTINEPDAGLWEFRNLKQQNCYTYLFHWAGSNAAKKMSRIFNDRKMEAKATKLSNLASQNIERCYNSEKQAYTQAIGIDSLDASSMQLITMNYLDHNSTRTHDHLKAIEKELMNNCGLFYRYQHQDDFGIPKNYFLICSFWYIESLACLNRVEEAIKCLDGLLKYTNHLGLFSEDIDSDGGQWGNFPQTYSHVGLMNAVFRISKKLDSPIFL